MKNILLLIILTSFIFLIELFNLSIISSTYAMPNGGVIGGSVPLKVVIKVDSDNNPKPEVNKNQPKVFKRQGVNNSRIYRVLEFCKKNKQVCRMNTKRIIRTDEEKRLIGIELIETINRYRENNK